MRKIVLLLLAVMISSMAFALSSSAVTNSFATETRDGDPPSAVTAVVNNYNDVTVSWGDPGYIWHQADPLGSTDGKAAQDFEAVNNAYDCEIAGDFMLTDTAVITDIQMAFFFSKNMGEGNPSEDWTPTNPIPYNIAFYADLDGVPSEDALFTTLTVPTLPSDTGWTTAEFATPITLDAGTYWVGMNARFDYAQGADQVQSYCLQRTGNEMGTSASWRNPGGGFGGETTWGAIANDVSFALKGSYSTRQLTGFKVYRDGVDVSGEVQAYTFEDTGLDAGTYEYTVTALDDEMGESTPSSAISVEVVLGAPTGFTASLSGANVVCQWNAPEAAGRALLNYSLYRNDEVLYEGIPGVFKVDLNVPDGAHTYYVVANYSGSHESAASNTVEVGVNVSGDNDGVNAATALVGNYPNPFNPVTNISYSLKEKGSVAIDIYDIKGRLVKNLVNDVKSAGSHKETWTGINNAGQEVGSGIYFYKMKTNTTSATKKMILMK